METTSICWLAVFVLLIVIELATMGLTTIWFAGGAVAGFIASMLGANVVIQFISKPYLKTIDNVGFFQRCPQLDVLLIVLFIDTEIHI